MGDYRVLIRQQRRRVQTTDICQQACPYQLCRNLIFGQQRRGKNALGRQHEKALFVFTVDEVTGDDQCRMNSSEIAFLGLNALLP